MLVLEEIGLWGQKAVSSAHLLLGNTQDRTPPAARLLPPPPPVLRNLGRAAGFGVRRAPDGLVHSNSTAENYSKELSLLASEI